MKIDWRDGERLQKGDTFVPEMEHYEVLGEASPPRDANPDYVYYRVRHTRLSPRRPANTREIVMGVPRDGRYAVVR